MYNVAAKKYIKIRKTAPKPTVNPITNSSVSERVSFVCTLYQPTPVPNNAVKKIFVISKLKTVLRFDLFTRTSVYSILFGQNNMSKIAPQTNDVSISVVGKSETFLGRLGYLMFSFPFFEAKKRSKKSLWKINGSHG